MKRSDRRSSLCKRRRRRRRNSSQTAAVSREGSSRNSPSADQTPSEMMAWQCGLKLAPYEHSSRLIGSLLRVARYTSEWLDAANLTPFPCRTYNENPSHNDRVWAAYQAIARQLDRESLHSALASWREAPLPIDK